jgi:hypothetical protein
MFKQTIIVLTLIASFGYANEGRIKEACSEDIKTLCPDVKPGGKRIIKCLKSQMDQVSDGCKSAVKEAKAKRKHKA